MPKVRWTDLPPNLRRHLFDRVADRQIQAAGLWYKDFGSFKICGEGELPKTFLLKGQVAKGESL